MKRPLLVVAAVWLAGSLGALAGQPATEDFESGYTDGEPLRVHAGWFFEEENDSPACEDGAGRGGTWGVAKGDRCFTWVAHPFNWKDAELNSVTFGGDWQTDADGQLDDDRAGWSISDESDSSDNVFGVQMDPGGEGESGLNIECYWDGDTVGDDGGRTSIVALPELNAETWYQLRVTFTKLSDTSARIDVSFVELDEEGNPTGAPIEGTVADTSQMEGTEGNELPNPRYFAADQAWPVFKNYKAAGGGFDNAYFKIETGEAAATVKPESEPEAKSESATEPEPQPEAEIELELEPELEPEPKE